MIDFSFGGEELESSCLQKQIPSARFKLKEAQLDCLARNNRTLFFLFPRLLFLSFQLVCIVPYEPPWEEDERTMERRTKYLLITFVSHFSIH